MKREHADIWEKFAVVALRVTATWGDPWATGTMAYEGVLGSPRHEQRQAQCAARIADAMLQEWLDRFEPEGQKDPG